jgi:hypothetical protein
LHRLTSGDDRDTLYTVTQAERASALGEHKESDQVVSETTVEPGVPDITTWPTIRDVMDATHYSQTYIMMCVRDGTLKAYRTRLGWLLDPVSVAQWRATRPARKPGRGKMRTA